MLHSHTLPIWDSNSIVKVCKSSKPTAFPPWLRKACCKGLPGPKHRRAWWVQGSGLQRSTVCWFKVTKNISTPVNLSKRIGWLLVSIVFDCFPTTTTTTTGTGTTTTTGTGTGTTTTTTGTGTGTGTGPLVANAWPTFDTHQQCGIRTDHLSRLFCLKTGHVAFLAMV